MASCAFLDGRLLGGCLIGQWVMAEGEKAPAIRLREALAVLNRGVDAVEFPVEKSSSGGLVSRTVREGRIENPRKFFNKDGAFRKDARLYVGIQIPCLYVDMMEFWEVGLAIVQGIRRRGSADKNPPAKSCWYFQPAVGSENGRGVLLCLRV